MNELVYITEDDESIRYLLKSALETFSYSVKTFENAEKMLAECSLTRPDLVLLDLMLPGMGGLEALRSLKSNPRTSDVPVIILTAKSQEIDKVGGLDLGADDYITKPFGVLELNSRIKAVLRRCRSRSPEILRFKDLIMDINRHEVTVGGNKVELTVKEFELLKMLLKNSPNVLSRSALLDGVWGIEFEGETRTLDMHIKTLRSKLGDDAENPKYIQTVRGVGYVMKG